MRCEKYDRFKRGDHFNSIVGRPRLVDIALLVPNFQIARYRQVQRRCYTSSAETIRQAIRWKNRTNKLVLVSEDFFRWNRCNADGAVRRFDRTFVNFKDSGNIRVTILFVGEEKLPNERIVSLFYIVRWNLKVYWSTSKLNNLSCEGVWYYMWYVMYHVMAVIYEVMLYVMSWLLLIMEWLIYMSVFVI